MPTMKVFPDYSRDAFNAILQEKNLKLFCDARWSAFSRLRQMSRSSIGMRPPLSSGNTIKSCSASRLSLAGEEGISVEVIDPRTLKPLDHEAFRTSVAKTGRLVIVDNAHGTCSVGSEIAAVFAEEALDLLRRPIVRLSAPDIHVPFSPALEKDF